MINPLITISLLSLFTVAALAEPNVERQAELIFLLEQDCGSCHGMTLKGGLGPPLLPGALRGKSDDALVSAIVYGRPGTPMPPWRNLLTDAEVRWLISRLRSGGKP